MSITLHRSEARTTVTIHGKQTYDATVSKNPLGTVVSLEHALGSLDDRLREREIDLQQFHRQSEDLTKKLATPLRMRKS